MWDDGNGVWNLEFVGNWYIEIENEIENDLSGLVGDKRIKIEMMHVASNILIPKLGKHWKKYRYCTV